MTAAEIEKLHRDYCKGRKIELRDQLIKVHRGLAVHLASRYVSPGFSLDEAIAAAYRGLQAAVERYVPGRAKFSTFAYWWVQKHVLREKSELKNVVKLPVGAVRKGRKVRQLRGTGLSEAAIAKQLKVSEEMVFELGHIHEAACTPVYLHTNSGGFDTASTPVFTSVDHAHPLPPLEDGGIVANWVSCPDPSPNPREMLEEKESVSGPRSRLAAALDKLSPRQRKIIDGRMTTPPTPFVELSRKVAMSPEGCRKLFMKSMSQLKKLMKSDEKLD